ncbi:MAG: PIN domain-containing protein [Burkholderiales bacterium]
MRLLGLDPDMALESCALPGDFHADPADRFLVASARLRNLTLVTRDQRILDYAARGYLKVLAA